MPEVRGLRPTGDRARETLFNWLQAVIPGARCLDLFAGTGALGLEALSRGAASTVFVERDRRLADTLREIAASWPGGERIEVVQADALKWLQGNERLFDLVFIDPPFADALQGRVLDALAGHLAPDARVYIEQDARASEIEPPEGFAVLRSKTLGDVCMTLLCRRCHGPPG